MDMMSTVTCSLTGAM